MHAAGPAVTPGQQLLTGVKEPFLSAQLRGQEAKAELSEVSAFTAVKLKT